MARDAHPTDALLVDVLRTLTGSSTRLRGLLEESIRRGIDPNRAGTAEQRAGDQLAAYRLRQLARINAELDDLKLELKAYARSVPAKAYTAGIRAVDATAVRRPIGRASGVANARAVETIASQLDLSFTTAVERSRARTADVFAELSRVAGGTQADANAIRSGVTILGRRVDDTYRAATVRSIAEGLAGGETRREITEATVNRLVREGTADALTGFVDSAGKRWGIETYSSMAVRTTTRQTVTTATHTRLVDSGLDLVTISRHEHPADECTPYEGNTYSLTGKTPGYPVLDQEPPFHPNCVHVSTPAGVELDVFEAQLAAEVAALV